MTAMKARSPVLGYNHNVRYGGRVWHVQTEDSGVQNPHIFTHLFNDGTIVASKKTDYDATSEVSAVQKLMQTQHKLMMRDLKSGTFDEKIEKYFGPIVREPEVKEADSQEPEPTSAEPSVRDERPTLPSPVPVFAPPVAPPPKPTSPPPVPTNVRPRQASLTPARPAVSVSARSNAAAPPTIGGRSSVTATRSPPPTIGSSRSGVHAKPADGVVMARPAVIVGNSGNKDGKGEVADFWKSNERRPEPQFGGDLISEKSLDEVILAYLSEDAPKK